MRFTTEERVINEKWFDKIRNHASTVQNSPKWIALEPYKDMHVWQRLYEVCAMSDTELREMITADNVLFRKYELEDDVQLTKSKKYDDLTKEEWDVLQEERRAFILANLKFLEPGSEALYAESANFDKVSVVYLYVRIRKMVASILRDPALVDLKSGEDLYIWKRLHYWHTISKADALEAIEADYRLFYIW